MICLSHPDKRLAEHLTNVRKIGLEIFKNKDSLKFRFSKDIIHDVLSTILYYHDIGKATIFFQQYLRASINKKKCKHKQDLINHSLISALIVAYKVIQDTNDDFLAALSFVCVRKHHGNFEKLEDMLATNKESILRKQFEALNLSDFNELRDINFDDLWNNTRDLFLIDVDRKIEDYILLNFLFSILTYSDKMEVIFGDANFIELPSESKRFVDTYKKMKFKDSHSSHLNDIRNNIYDESLKALSMRYKDNNIFSLNVPTGSGKTLTAFNLALNLINEDKRLKRVIYVLPFTSIVDQTSQVIKEVLKFNNYDPDKYITIHHHLAEVKAKNDENFIGGDKAQFLIENWDTPIVLTTFWQLFNSILTNRNSQLRKFHNIANSVIILDEVQSIPYKYWNLVRDVFMELARVMNCKILFLTATMPLIFREDEHEILPLISNERKKKYFSSFSRYHLNIINDGEKIKTLHLDELYEISKKDIENNSDSSFLFVFNTIKSSIKFYDMLKNDFPDKDLLYLSTNILPIKRKRRINKIKENTGNKIIVSTQIIEAGVDIDIDIIYRDFAPLDSIIQTSGRCNRNNLKNHAGKVILFKLKNKEEKYDYNYIYKGLTLENTEEILATKKRVKESELLNVINEYYCIIKKNSSQNESAKLLDSIKSLDYEYISTNFKLIDEIPGFLMFLEVDSKAKKILEEFNKALSIKDRFERKNNLLKIKSSFLSICSIGKIIKRYNKLRQFF